MLCEIILNIIVSRIINYIILILFMAKAIEEENYSDIVLFPFSFLICMNFRVYINYISS